MAKIRNQGVGSCCFRIVGGVLVFRMVTETVVKVMLQMQSEVFSAPDVDLV